ncbi:MAG: DUF61 family protein [Candidatus Thorarchaeota archaeon]
MGRFLERMIEREIDSANDHLPQRRIPLTDLLSTDSPIFKTRCGEDSAFIKEEVQMFADKIPSAYHSSILLPVVILRRRDLGSGIYTVTGSKVELFFIQQLLGYVDLGWGEFSRWQTIDRFVRPQVQLLRRKLPSTSVIGFVGTSTP